MLKHIVAWLVVGVAIVSISAGLAIYKKTEIETAAAAAAASPEPSEAVATVRARRGEWTASTRAIGTVVALRQLEIRNEIAGTISELGFTSGSIAEAGQTLVQFDVRQEQAALEASQAEARLTKLTLDRRESLRGSPAFSAQELDKSREELAAATARARALEVAIEKKRIIAPFKARVGITNLQAGAYLDVGTLIVTLQGVDTDAYVDFTLPQDGAAALQVGSTVTLTSAALTANPATAKIVAEDNSVDAGNRAVRFRAVVAGLGETLRPGTFVDVTAITSQPREAVMVPLAALRRSPSGQHVFVIAEEDGKLRARERSVETSAVQGSDVAVEKGLDGGELIAASGSFKLRDGLLVQTEIPPQANSGDRVN
jgi:membrane fusion protein (multidrug efflux system)